MSQVDSYRWRMRVEKPPRPELFERGRQGP